MPTVGDYLAAFEKEQANEYPVLDEFEKQMGHSVPRTRLEAAALPLACPVKVNPPNWQHGRVIYALVRRLLDHKHPGNLLDIGTAKGFSAVVASWALADGGQSDRKIYSVDVMHPEERTRRNSIMELEGYRTIEEYTSMFLQPKVDVRFYGGGSQPLLQHLVAAGEKLAFAFVDGKHALEDVRREAVLISQLQDRGGVILFDDCQIPAVITAVRAISGYVVRYLEISPARRYAIATRK